MFDACVFTDEVSPDFPEAVRLAAEAGAKQLEIRGKLFGKAIQDLTAEDVGHINAACEEWGVGIGSLGSPVGKCSYENPEELERHDRIFQRMLELSEEFECPIIRGFALWAPNRGADWERDHAPYMQAISDFLLPKAQEAESRGAILALENEWDTMFGTCAEGLKIIQAMGEPEGLGVVWDFGNSLRLGEQPYPTGYEIIEPWIVHVHVKPNEEGFANPLPGSEDVTLGEAISRLWNDGYEGCISVEHFPGPEKTLLAVQTVSRTIESVMEVSKRTQD